MATDWIIEPDSNGATIRISSLVSVDKWLLIGRSLGLTSRQLELIQYVLNGDKVVSIAEAMGISSHTVHSHLVRVYKKLEVTCQRELAVRIFAQYVLLEPVRRSSRAKGAEAAHAQPICA